MGQNEPKDGEKINASKKDNKEKSNRVSGQSNELYGNEKENAKEKNKNSNNNSHAKRDDAAKKM